MEKQAEALAGGLGRTVLPAAGGGRRATAPPGALVRGLLASGNLTVLFQPIVRLEEEGRVRGVGFEALVRPAPESAWSGAEAMFAAVRQARLEVDADRLCLALALAAARSLQQGDLTVNVHAETLLRDLDFPAHVRQTCALTGIGPGRLVLELVEHRVEGSSAGLLQPIGRLRELGVRIALDDIGAGRPQLGLLRHIRPDFLKLDRRLLLEPRPAEELRRLLRSFARAAARLGAGAVVEGVERPEHLALLRSQGLSLAQGFLFGEPRPAVAWRDEPTFEMAAGEGELPSEWEALERLGLAALLLDAQHHVLAVSSALREMLDGPGAPRIGRVFEPAAARPDADRWVVGGPHGRVSLFPVGRVLGRGMRVLQAMAEPRDGDRQLLRSDPAQVAWLELDAEGTILAESNRATHVLGVPSVTPGQRLDQLWRFPGGLPSVLSEAEVHGLWQGTVPCLDAQASSDRSRLSIEPRLVAGGGLRGFLASGEADGGGEELLAGQHDRESRRLQLLNRVFAAALEDADFAEVARVAVAGVAELYGGVVACCRVGVDGRPTGAGWQAPERPPISRRLTREERELLARGEPVIVRDVASDPRVTDSAPELFASGVGAFADFPLAHGGRLYGVLRLASEVPRRFAAHELRAMTEIALALTIALRRVQDRELRDNLAEELDQHSRRLARQVALVEGAPDGMALFDPTGRLVFANSAFGRLFGWRDDHDGSGKSWARLGLHPAAEVERIRGEALAELERGGWWRGEVEALRADGTVFPAELTLSRLPEAGYGCSIRDLTREWRLARQADESRTLLSRITDAVPGAVFRLVEGRDGELSLAFLSAGARRLLELPEQAPLPDVADWLASIVEVDRERCWSSLRLAREQSSAVLEFRVSTALSRAKWLRVEAAASLREDGVRVWDGVASDVSDLKTVEQELWRARSEWCATVDGVADMVVLEDHRGRILRCNLAFAKALGRSFQALIGRDLASLLLGPEAAATSPDLLRQPTALAQFPWSSDWFEVSNRELPERSRAIAAWVHVLRNVTSQRRFEEEARRLEAAIAQARDAVVVLGRRGVVVYANRAFASVVSSQPEEVHGRRLADLGLTLGDRSLAREIGLRLIAGEPWNGTISLLGRDGAPREFEVNLSPIADPGGRMQHFVAVGRDVTERRRLDALAESINLTEQVGFVFATLRHEIGNPINSMKAGLSVLREQQHQLPAEVVAEYLDRLLGEVGRVEQLLRLFKSFSSFDRLRPEWVDAQAFFADFAHLVADDVARRGVELAWSVDPAVGGLSIDPRALNQVLLNLVTNAAEALAGRRDGWIQLTARRRGNLVALEVVDNGPGIPEEVQPRVFRPFFTTKQHGSGLGLAVVRRLLAKMGGTAEIISQPGKGVTVRMLLEGGERSAPGG
jgi:PAS domain S-box-containing protein